MKKQNIIEYLKTGLILSIKFAVISMIAVIPSYIVQYIIGSIWGAILMAPVYWILVGYLANKFGWFK